MFYGNDNRSALLNRNCYLGIWGAFTLPFPFVFYYIHSSQLHAHSVIELDNLRPKHLSPIKLIPLYHKTLLLLPGCTNCFNDVRLLEGIVGVRISNALHVLHLA
jgi:hypothetical protein